MGEVKPSYPLPCLAEVGEDELKSFATAVDAVGHGNPCGGVWVSGSVSEGTHEGYIFPIVSLWSTNREIVEDVARMLEAPLYVHDRSPYDKPLYITIVTREHAVAAILYARPYLTRWAKRVDEILEKYRESPQLPTGGKEGTKSIVGSNDPSVEELTGYQIRLNYERIVRSLLDMVKPFHALMEDAPDPELRKAAGEAWDTVRRVIAGLRDRFGLAWVDSEEYGKEFEEDLGQD